MMARRSVIVARYTQEELAVQEAIWRDRGFESAYAQFAGKTSELERQKRQLDLEQTKVVTDLMRAAGENLSKAGYLIGKLNKDNSR